MSALFGFDAEKEKTNAPKEGELFKEIRIYGKIFEIKYGFYEEKDRYAKYAEPVEIYPNFIENPQFTDDGVPFATAMQIPCEHFEGKIDENSVCDNCKHYRQCEHLLGICECPANRKTKNEK